MISVRKSFANRLILHFTFVVFIGFLAIYFLFNSLMDNHIRTEAEAELNREIMTVSDNEIYIAEFINPEGDHVEVIFGAPVNSNRTILNVDTIIIDSDGVILLPSQFTLSETEIRRTEVLVNFFNNNQNLFDESDDMIMTSHAGHTFYMRAASHYAVQTEHFFFTVPVPVFVLMYTDITPAINLNNSMNQILLILLTISGILSLIISILLSTRFKESINRLKEHAETIGGGNFDEKIEGFNYLEFTNLGGSMNNMASMLKAYESNQKQFFQNASHELRTPLMSIQGYTEGLQSGVFESSEATEVILEESNKMTELINDILYLSRLDANVSSQLNISPTSINTLITNSTERIKIIADAANKQIITELPTDIEIKTDIDKLERAIINILSNAIRYAKSEIYINYIIKNDELNITIANDGSPIDEKDLPHIFDRFYKGSSGNTGLGLAITKDIITRLDGTIHASNQESGVKFVIRLPQKSE